MVKLTNRRKTQDYVYDISLDGTFVNALGENVCHNTDGFNFSKFFIKDLDKRHYVGKGLNREVQKGKEYTGFKADVAEFNDLFMRGKMGLGIDEVIYSSINIKRKNYSDLLLNEKTGELEKKLVGNSIKSKKMPVYIEKFLDKAIDMLLRKQGQSFLEYYYDYIEKIYNYQIPLRDIASKGKIKKTLEEYVADCETLTKSGAKKARQAWYELLLREEPRRHVDIADVIYYINTGKKHGDSDAKKLTDYYTESNGEKIKLTKEVTRSFDKFKKKGKELIKKIENKEQVDKEEKDTFLIVNSEGKYELKYTKLEILTKEGKNRQYLNSPECYEAVKYNNIYSQNTIILNCKLLKNEIIEAENDTFCDEETEYNSEKYIVMLNKRITPLLVCFKPEIRSKILITNPLNRQAFTEEESELDSGHPLKAEDQDTYEALMTPNRQEMEFWTKVNEEPPFIKEIGMDWEKMKKDFYELLEKEKDSKFQAINTKYIAAVEHLSNDEIEDFVESSKIPDSIAKYVYINSDMGDLNFYFKEIPDMSPTCYRYVGDINYELMAHNNAKSFEDEMEI